MRGVTTDLKESSDDVKANLEKLSSLNRDMKKKQRRLSLIHDHNLDISEHSLTPGETCSTGGAVDQVLEVNSPINNTDNVLPSLDLNYSTVFIKEEINLDDVKEENIEEYFVQNDSKMCIDEDYRNSLESENIFVKCESEKEDMQESDPLALPDEHMEMIKSPLTENHKRKATGEHKRLDISNSTLQTSKQNINDCKKIDTISFKKAKLRSSKFEKLEQTLLKELRQVSECGIKINGNLIKDKASQIAEILSINDFSATKNWLRSFRYRNGLHNMGKKSCHLNLAWNVEDYELDCIYNVDETGLYFNLLPNKTRQRQGQKCVNGELSDERVSVILGVNAAGEKLPPLVIGKYEKPKCFNNVNILPTNYESNKNAWVTSEIFANYLHTLDAKMRNMNKKIVLVLEKSTAHPPNIRLDNIKLIFVHAYKNSRLEPLRLGIIADFKLHYRKLVIQKCISMLDRGWNIDDIKLSILDAMSFILVSWNQVSGQKIIQCFKKAGFISFKIFEPMKKYAFSDGCHVKEDITKEDCLRVGLGVSMEEYFQVDNELHVTGVSAGEITRLMEDDSGEDSRPVPSYNEACLALDVVKCYLLSAEGDESVHLKLNDIDKQLHKTFLKKNSKRKTSSLLMSRLMSTGNRR